MENIAAFVRAIRIAQSLTQRDIASYVGIHHSSIALFETGRSKLSLTTVVRMAPFLNLNPAFIETGEGSPFKPKRPGEVIKLLLSPKPERGVDFYLLDLVLTNAEKAGIVALLPPVEQAKGKLGIAGFYYAIAVRDSEGVVYLLRGRDGQRLTGSIRELQDELLAIASEKKGDFHTETVRVTKEIFEKLQAWSIQSADELSALFKDGRKTASRDILLLLVDALFSDKDDKRMAHKTVSDMPPLEADLVAHHLEAELRKSLSGRTRQDGE